jgi:hypothetical protein
MGEHSLLVVRMICNVTPDSILCVASRRKCRFRHFLKDVSKIPISVGEFEPTEKQVKPKPVKPIDNHLVVVSVCICNIFLPNTILRAVKIKLCGNLLSTTCSNIISDLVILLQFVVGSAKL